MFGVRYNNASESCVNDGGTKHTTEALCKPVGCNSQNQKKDLFKCLIDYIFTVVSILSLFNHSLYMECQFVKFVNVYIVLYTFLYII